MAVHRAQDGSLHVAEVAQLRELAGSCIGPLGKLKIVRGGADGSIVIVTSSSQRLLNNVTAQSPFARLLLELSRAQRGRGGDGGLLMLALAANLVVNGVALGIGRLSLCATLEACLAVCHDAMLEGEWPISAHMHWRDLALPTALARSTIGAKRATLLAATELEHLSALVVDAFVRTYSAGDGEAEGSAGSSGLQCIRTQGVVGVSPMRSHVVEGVLMDARPPSDCPDCLREGTRLALFDIVLDGSPPPPAGSGGRTGSADVRYEYQDGPADVRGKEHDGGLRRASARDEDVQAKGAQLVLAAFVDWMCAHGVGIVASQKVISPDLQHMLLARHIVPIERLSLRHVDAVRRVSGALVQSSSAVGSLSSAALGAVGQMGTRRVGRHALTLLTSPRQTDATHACVARARAVVTLVLCGQTSGALDELTAAVATAQNALANATRDPRVCPGGGASEWLLARRVREQAAAWRRSGTHPIGFGARPGEVQAACDMFASALEAVPLTMARALGERDTAAEAPGDLGVCSEERGADGRLGAVGYAGCDTWLGCVCEVMRVRRVAGGCVEEPDELEVSSGSVLDLASTKMHAIASAVHVATVLLKVDQSLHSAEGGSQQLMASSNAAPLLQA